MWIPSPVRVTRPHRHPSATPQKTMAVAHLSSASQSFALRHVLYKSIPAFVRTDAFTGCRQRRCGTTLWLACSKALQGHLKTRGCAVIPSLSYLHSTGCTYLFLQSVHHGGSVEAS